MESSGKAIRVVWIDSNGVTREAIQSVFALRYSDIEMSAYRSVEDAANGPDNSPQIVGYSHHRYDGNLGSRATSLRSVFLGTGLLIVLHDQDPNAINQIQQMQLMENIRSFGLLAAHTSSVHALYAALKFVLAGGVFLPSAPITDAHLETHRKTLQTGPHGELTPREREVQYAIQSGMSNKVIAYTLGLSESTIKVHVRNLMRKTGAANRVQVALNASQNGRAPSTPFDREKMD
jgi:DNA-binding NarL/FixJ family response regulator